MKRCFLFLFCLCFHLIHADEVRRKVSKEFDGKTVEVEVISSDDKITVAESLLLTLKIKLPENFSVVMPTEKELGLSFEFNERSHRFRPTDISSLSKTKLPDGSSEWVQTYTLEPWLSENYSIPPILFPIKEMGKDSDKPLGFLFTEAIRIPVEKLPNEKDQISGLLPQADLSLASLRIKERRAEDFTPAELKKQEDRIKKENLLTQNRDFPWYIVWILLSIGLFYYLGNKFIKNKALQLFAKHKEPAHIKALRALNDLVNKNLISKGMVKEFYYELSYILREYIEGRYGIIALHQSSEEFFENLLRSNPFGKQDEEKLQAFMEFSDNVKYSLFRPEDNVHSKSVEQVKTFIETTKLELKED